MAFRPPSSTSALLALLSLLAVPALTACTGKDDTSPNAEDTAPIVTLGLPTDVARRYAGVPFVVNASVSDDTEAPGSLTFAWSSDVSGPLTVAGAPDTTGAWPASIELEEGTHALSLEATDSAGNRTASSVIVVVGATNSAPSCSIVAPLQGETLALGESARLRGQVDDVDQGGDGLIVEWSSDVDGPLGEGVSASDGTSSLSTSALSRGAHLLTVRVADELGSACSDTVDVTVSSPPTLELDAPLDGDLVNEGALVELRGTVTDADDDADALLLTVESSEDGVVYEDAPSASGRFLDDIAGLSVGTHLLSVTATDTSGLSTSVTVELTVNGLPTAPTVRIDPDPAITTDELLAVVATASSDAERDDVTYAYRWYRNGVLSAASSTEALPASATARGETWSVEVVPNDGFGDGAVGTAALVIDNAPPSLASVSIAPTSPDAGDTLTCTASGWSDADGDAERVTYAWTIDGVAAGTGATLSGGFVGGDVVTCTATPNDGIDSGTAVSASVTVANSAPVLSSVVLTPSPAYEASTLTCTPTASDADGSALTYAYTWSVGGADPGVVASTLTGASFSRGDAVTCSVTVSDGAATTSAVTSNRVTISNTAPVLTGAVISPRSPVVGDALSCSGTGYSDADGDADASTYAWTVNGVAAGASSTLTRTLRRGDVIACTVTPNDGSTAGTAVSTSVTVANSTPSITAVSITPATAYASSTLTCASSGWSDADGDTEQTTYAWTVDGVAAGTGATLRGAFVGGDVVTCTGTPNDGLTTGTARSASVAITNSAPVLASTTVTASTGTARIGATYTCTPGTTTDADGTTSFSYAYAWYLNGSVVSAATSSTFSSSSAVRGATVACSATPTDGTTAGSEVRSSALTVENTLPILTGASISPTTVRVGDTLTCASSGGADADGDAVSVSYRWLNGTTLLGTGTTLSSGFSGRQTITCEATPSDAYGAGTAVTAAIIITNTAPSISSVSITPSPAYAASTLTCAGVGYTDADGDADSSRYAWTVNGVTRGSSATLSGAFVYGDVVACTVTPYDGSTSGTALSSSVTVSNTAPVVASATITPSSPTESSTLTCTPGTTTDADRTTSFSYTYAWKVNGASVAATGTALTGTYFDAGDSVVCAVSASDGTSTGTAVSSTAVTIANTPPTISSVSVSPTTAYAGTTLTCSYSGYFDADGHADASTYAWTIDGVAAGTWSTLSSGFVRGDVVTCTVTPYDGRSTGTARSASVTVSNTAPSLTSASISPSPARAGDALTCTANGYADPDGDAAANTFAWTRNGTSVGTGSTYTGTLVRGDVVQCTATPSDGFGSGTAVSTSLTISNTAPTAPAVSVSPETATASENIRCSVSTASTDVDGDSVSYTYAWARNGVSYPAAGSSSTLSASYTSAGETWTCSVTASDGSGSATGSATASICVANTYYIDVDGDGYGLASRTISACSVLDGYAEVSGDCDEGDASVYPGAFESCDGADNDCDGSTDEEATDADGDGWRVCDGDCDDDDAFANPGYAEICENGVDDDCDGDIDIADVDGDGYLGCGEEDCNDASADAYPGGTEVDGDLLDNDCDGEVDDTLSDDDEDGYTEADGDCNDAAPWINPGATEIPDDEEDQDCDGAEVYAVDFTTTGMGIFVDASVGDDFFPGTQEFPVKTIARGVALAAAGVPVLVAEGTYVEPVSTSRTIHGGYSSDWTSRPSKTAITGTVVAGSVSGLDILGTLSVSGTALDVVVESKGATGLSAAIVGRAVVFAADAVAADTYGINANAVTDSSVWAGSPAKPSTAGASGYDSVGVYASNVYGVVVNGATAGDGATGSNGGSTGDDCRYLSMPSGGAGGSGGNFTGIEADIIIGADVNGGSAGDGAAGGSGGSATVTVGGSCTRYFSYCYGSPYGSTPSGGAGGSGGSYVGAMASTFGESISVFHGAFSSSSNGAGGAGGTTFNSSSACLMTGSNGASGTTVATAYGTYGVCQNCDVELSGTSGISTMIGAYAWEFSSGSVLLDITGSATGLKSPSTLTASGNYLMISASTAASAVDLSTRGGTVSSSVAVAMSPSGAALLTSYTASILTNNTAIGANGAYALRTSSSGLVVANNILYVDDGSMTCLYSGGTYTYFANNLFYGCSGQFVYDTTLGAYRTSIAAVNFLTATTAYGNNITGDPLFTDVTNGDYSLTSSSPAVNSGRTASSSALGSVTTDILGNPRPSGSAYDIGAYEVQ